MSENENKRPSFPKRIVITGGMPYGNKDLHFGHIGGVFIHADIFARFMRDRIGRENVIFISGTDCYGSPIVEHYRQVKNKGEFNGTIEDFVRFNHNRQIDALKAYSVDLNLFAASGLDRSGEIHHELCGEFFKKLYRNGHLIKHSSLQFYDTKFNVFLNGRQVTGQCPIPGCSSEKAYADECSLGHPYEPKDLINPKSALSDEKPEMRNVTNWYIDLEKFKVELTSWANSLSSIPGYRPFAISSIKEFLEPPAIYVKQDHSDLLNELATELPPYKRYDEKNKSIKLVFDTLAKRESACAILSKKSVRYRTGKTLVPFRLTGNVEWGVPIPNLEDNNDEIDNKENKGKNENLTFWVWPESLWAPISFTATYLEKIGRIDKDEWKKWWCSDDSKVYQFIGEDNVFFYSVAEMSMFMGNQNKTTISSTSSMPTPTPADGDLKMPHLIVNYHLLFFDKKASSSGKIVPPMARELLDHYTADQLRTHFFALWLGGRNVAFMPKPFNPNAKEKDADPVLKEGNLLSNVLNKAVRTCFYTTQKYFNGQIPVGEISASIIHNAKKSILDYEEAMFKHEFHQAMTIVDNYSRSINKFWTQNFLPGQAISCDNQTQRQALIDAFHMVRVAMILLHPIAPNGTEMVREYLNVGEEFWNWERIFDSIFTFMPDPQNHPLKVLEPRIDFFPKHPSQF
ncbi:MAG: class I tRNA ligase family protein [Oligoflexia bacterium]|nr:class I tRNA ligase family protein [Oligoflexia bacterium]